MGCETPCSLADKCLCYRETCYILSATLFHPDDGSDTFLCNDNTHASHYVASHCPTLILFLPYITVDSSWNVMAHGDAQEGKWKGNWRMEWVANTLHTTSEHGVSSITTADAHTSAASSRLNWHPGRFKWTRPFRRKTKSGFCACAITFQTQSNTDSWQLTNPNTRQRGAWRRKVSKFTNRF